MSSRRSWCLCQIPSSGTASWPRTGRQPSPSELRGFCTERLPLYMVPEQLEVLLAFPRTSTGKADRQALTRSWTTKENI